MGKKKCTTCGDDKDINEFNKNKSKKDGYNNICRVCSNARSKRYYQENRDHHIKLVSKRRIKTVTENRIKLFDYYKLNPCIDCGESDPIVLELDHRDESDKEYNVSEMINFSWKNIRAEIDKCDVRCANCHRRRTAIQQSWYRDII